jgi:hypothetical protein
MTRGICVESAESTTPAGVNARLPGSRGWRPRLISISPSGLTEPTLILLSSLRAGSKSDLAVANIAVLGLIGSLPMLKDHLQIRIES